MTDEDRTGLESGDWRPVFDEPGYRRPVPSHTDPTDGGSGAETPPPTTRSGEPDGDPRPKLDAPWDDESSEVRVRRKGHRPFWVELPILVALALIIAVIIKTFLIQAFFIPSASMRDTLIEGDRVMVNKLAYRFGDLEPGQVIVFDSPLAPTNDGESFLSAVVRNIGEALGLSTPETALIKRVVALGGQTVEIRGGTLFVDGLPVDEPYLRSGMAMADFGPVSVPLGHVFVLGDNRNHSEDSRRFGSIPESSIVGRAFVRVWPPGRWGGL